MTSDSLPQTSSSQSSSSISRPVQADAARVRSAWLELLTVLVIFAAALTVRVYRLDEFPPGLYLDEAANGVDALQVLAGERPVFFTRNTGREPLFIYLQAALIALFGASPHTLRLTAALIGALAVPAVYWMAREAFAGSRLGARRLATWSALFMAFGYWHISLSRIGFRANLLILLAAVTFACFWRAWHRLLRGERFPWWGLIVTGALLGLTLYTYTAARIMPLLLVAVVGASLLQPGPSPAPGGLGVQRKRIIGALAVITMSSVVIFAPLGLYFLRHPDAFLGRTLSVSVLNPIHNNGRPLLALASSAWETAKMFFISHDINLRHNPAQRPVFDVLAAAWLAVGLVVAVGCWLLAAGGWRLAIVPKMWDAPVAKQSCLPYFFVAIWFVLLALPAVLTAEGVPHSLRATGMIPVVYILPVLGMLTVGLWLAPRAPLLRHWLPLPFLLFSAFTSVYAYANAWQQPQLFRSSFLPHYVDLAKTLSQLGDADAAWVVPLSPNYYVLGETFHTMDFIYAISDAETGYASILAKPARAAARLTELMEGRRFAYLLRARNTEELPEAGYILGDPKHLIKFLLDKYGVQVGQEEPPVLDMPYLVYELPAHTQFAAWNEWTVRRDSFDGRVVLTGVDYGRTAAGQADADVSSRAIHAGDPLWVALRWVAETPIDIDLKTSLYLKDGAGHVVGRVDDLLVSDRYPLERIWIPGEEAYSYHIVPTLSAIAPGPYDLYLHVYEDATLRPYPARDEQGNAAGADAHLGRVEVLPARVKPAIDPQHVPATEARLAPELVLRGYDLPDETIAPGDSLPLTLYWQAVETPTADYVATVRLQGADGETLAEQTRVSGNDEYPTTQWAAGTVVRDWRDLPIPPTTPSGQYSLFLSVINGKEADEHVSRGISLGEITVAGRPRLFEAPPVRVAAEVTFGQTVRLLGLTETLPTSAQPGDMLSIPLVWHVIRPDQRALVRFVHLLGSDGQLVAQQDDIPCAGECPAATWLPNEILPDAVDVTIPPDAAPGRYTLAVGWYERDTLERLAATDAQGAARPDQMVILPVDVVVR